MGTSGHELPCIGAPSSSPDGVALGAGQFQGEDTSLPRKPVLTHSLGPSSLNPLWVRTPTAKLGCPEAERGVGSAFLIAPVTLR